ncbi:MAG TPA: hypothetical protein VFF73_23605 [Planctomycetota bacterium]|nr:hypothetical protein [Planctomycetota bacterium]
MSVVRRLVDHNPFLLLSAVLVLSGGWLVAGDGNGIPLARLGGLFLFLQLYELALLGGTAFIERFVRGRDASARRDMSLLLLLEVLFLGELHFTSSVFPGMGTTGIELGVDREDLVAPIAVAVLSLLLGPVKLWLSGRAARIEWPRALYGYVFFALALIHLGPLLVLLTGESSNAQGAIGTLWWVAAFLPLVLTRAVAAGEGPMGPFAISRPRGVLVLGLALLVAAVAHVASASWAYRVAFAPWQPAPLVLGFAAAWPRLAPWAARSRATATVSLVAASVALLLGSSAAPDASVFVGPIETTPFRAIAVLATLVLVDAARIQRSPRFLYAATGSLLLVLLGGTPREVDATLLAPGHGTELAFAVVALAFTIVPMDHPIAALGGLAAACVLRGEVRSEWLLASLVLGHQLVLAQRHRSAPWLRLRTLLLWGTLATGLLALEPRSIGLADLHVVLVVGLAFVLRAHGRGAGYAWPASLAAMVLVGWRAIEHAPRGRTGIGLVALSCGALLLVAGLGHAVFRQRLAAWIDD